MEPYLKPDTYSVFSEPLILLYPTWFGLCLNGVIHLDMNISSVGAKYFTLQHISIL